MADEGDRQLNIPGVLEGEVKPDYNACIEVAAKEALRKMLFPSLLALLVPAIGVVLLGLEFCWWYLDWRDYCGDSACDFYGQLWWSF